MTGDKNDPLSAINEIRTSLDELADAFAQLKARSDDLETRLGIAVDENNDLQNEINELYKTFPIADFPNLSIIEKQKIDDFFDNLKTNRESIQAVI